MSRRFQFSLKGMLLLVAVGALPLVGWIYEPYRLAQSLRNTDVQWDGTRYGLRAHARGQPATSLLGIGRRATPALVQALDDPEKFAAAHFILTELWPPTSGGSWETWNGLRVDLFADGRTIVYDEQIPELRRYWAARLH